MDIDKAINKLVEFLDEPVFETYRLWLDRIRSMPGANGLFERIAVAADQETLCDYLAEALYILVFTGLGFQVEIEPYGKKGPDLKVSRDRNEAVVEITRFRTVHPGPPILNLSDVNAILSEYGNPARDIRKAIRKISKKFLQVGSEKSIIAIWNDDEDMEELEVEAAVHDLRNEESLPDGLLFIVYGSKWIGRKQLHCFPFRHSIDPHYALWQREFDSSIASEVIQQALG